MGLSRMLPSYLVKEKVVQCPNLLSLHFFSALWQMQVLKAEPVPAQSIGSWLCWAGQRVPGEMLEPLLCLSVSNKCPQ